MIFRQLFDKDSSTYSYLIGDDVIKEAILVDPVLEQCDRDLKLLEELGLTLVACLETHIHADHITGAAILKETTGCRILVPNHTHVTGADQHIQDGEFLTVGSVTIEAIATPGHTDSHMMYRINCDYLLTGDALLIRGCGRTDFQSGDAGLLYDSIHNRIFSLPDHVFIYPAHDYRGHTVSTIGEEKQYNPRFQNRDRDEFIILMGQLNLPHPKKLKEALPANQVCGAVSLMNHQNRNNVTVS